MLAKLDFPELAQLLAELPPAQMKVVVEQLLHDRRLARTLRALPDDLLPEIATHMGHRLLARALDTLEPDDATRVAQALDDTQRVRVFSLTDPDLAEQLDRLLHYPPRSAGSRMIPRWVSVAPDKTVGEAIRAIRGAERDVPLYYLYVVDRDGQLRGVASLGQLVKTHDDTSVETIMQPQVVSVDPTADQEEVARLVSRQNLLAIPVVDHGRLLGLVTIDDVIDVLEQEATEDMYNMAGLSEGDRVFSPPHRSLIKRLPWNALNLVTSLIAASVVGLFESTISRVVALATFMPVVAGIGGNTGNQTLTVIIRGITLGELEFSTALKALLKEVAVGLSIGLILGLTVAGIAVAWKGSPMLGVVIAVAMVANLCIAALVGTAIPLSLKWLGLDPALGGSILVTMCTDVFGFLSFLGLATIFLVPPT